MRLLQENYGILHENLKTWEGASVKKRKMAQNEGNLIYSLYSRFVTALLSPFQLPSLSSTAHSMVHLHTGSWV